MKDPGIHITRSKFLEIWNNMGGMVSEDFVDRFFAVARGFSLDHRSLFIKDKNLAEKAKKRTTGSTRDANLAADIIYATLIKSHRTGVKKTTQRDSQWGSVKELSILINEFCNNYQLKKREGYIRYIETGIQLLLKNRKFNYLYTAQQLISKNDQICDIFNAERAINSDKYPETTIEIYQIYNNKVLEKTGIFNNYKEDPTQYYNFLLARDLADKNGVGYDIFIDAQFDALDFCNGIPRLEDLHSTKAQERLIRYLSRNNISVNHRRKKITDDIWNSFK